MPEVAGDLGRNDQGQIVWAGDRVRVKREQLYHCMCDANCECVLVLKRGETPLKSGKPMADHFAYPATGKRTGCTGKIPTPEAKAHCDAKWLIHDKLGEFSFRDVCGVGHVVEAHHYDALEWMSTVEKKIPGTSRIADVLLENMFTEEVVAIEVFNTHKVDFLKAQDCKAANVPIIEVRADSVNAGTRVLDNERSCDEWDECVECVEAKKRDEQMRVQREFARKQSELHRLKEEAEQREIDERNKQDLIELGKRNRARQLARDANLAREHQVMPNKIGRTRCLTCKFGYSNCFHKPKAVE